MTNEFSFSDLLVNDVRRVMRTKINGLGVVTLTELSPAEVEVLTTESDSVIKLRDMANDFLATLSATPSEKEEAEHQSLFDEFQASDLRLVRRWACRFLKGGHVDEKEIDQLANNLSHKVIVDIYLRGTEFNIVRDAVKEDIEKNS